MNGSAANTLYVTTDGSYLSKESETLVISVERERRNQVPLMAISAVICFGRVMMSPDLMGTLVQRGIHVTFLSGTGKFLARIEGAPHGNVLLRREQHRAADSEERSLRLSRSFIAGKLINTRRFLVHATRDHESHEAREAIRGVTDHLVAMLKSLSEATTVETIRGIEGASAQSYFGVLGRLFKSPDEALRFEGRTRRPPKDPINALLSFGYTLLHSDCAGALNGVGLDPAIGFLHEDRPGRMSLALDLMEELRVPVVDRMVIALLNRGQLQAHDFVEQPGGEWRLTDAGRKTFLIAYQKAKQESIRHHFLDEETTWAMVPHLQARLLARSLRDDLDAYPPFEIRS